MSEEGGMRGEGVDFLICFLQMVYVGLGTHGQGAFNGVFLDFCSLASLFAFCGMHVLLVARESTSCIAQLYHLPLSTFP